MENFNLKDLVLSDSYAAPATATPQTGEIELGYPGKLDFCRVHPDKEYLAQLLILDDPRGKQTYITSPRLADELEGDAVPAVVALCANQHGEQFLWVAKLPWYDGEPFATTRLEAMDRARTEWVRLRRSITRKGYDIISAAKPFPEPVWSDETFENLIRQAFKNNVIGSLDHPIVKKLRGEEA
ncbi:hypothetical protein Pcar_0798 [Syntrophotalea carbinolica DSM 2380]|uniref:Uncharacterized protein n=1 Tax=Syntrophotalea carbinolica (strain DSM 2380 / NBRC 103641 / GraBd1) TaxID=338963 RepID=Q3A6F2_SYNC1|nr:hypothetical protein [Syntrophotalea carbinolica]ABA88055.1 hypothetical protein Pcar_0798 [Syntrophotalea carbinolica DSM 2380]